MRVNFFKVTLLCMKMLHIIHCHQEISGNSIPVVYTDHLLLLGAYTSNVSVTVELMSVMTFYVVTETLDVYAPSSRRWSV